MTSRSASVRLNVDQQDAKARLEELGQAGNRELDKVGASAERQTPKLDSLTRAVSRLQREYDPLSAAAEKLARDEAMLSDALDKGKVSAAQHQSILGGLTARRTALNEAIRAATPEAKAAAAAEREAAEAAKRHALAVAEEERALTSLLERTNPVGTAIKRLQADQAALTKAHADGKVSAAEFATGSAVLAERLQQLGTASRFTHTQMAILQSGAINTVQSIAAGLPTYQVLTTQLFQTAPAFAGMAARAAAVGVPLIAVAAAALLVGSRISSMNDESRRIDEVWKRVNPTLEQGADRLRKLSFEVAALTGAARSDAMSGIAVLAQLRNLPGELLEPLSKLAPDLAAVLGGDIPKAAEDLGRAFTRGAAGIREMDDRLQFLTVREREQINMLDQQGKRTEAYRVAAAALGRQFSGTAQAMQSDWGRALTALGKGWDAFVEYVASRPLVVDFGKMLGGVGRGAERYFSDETTRMAQADIARQTVARVTDEIRDLERQREDLNRELAGDDSPRRRAAARRMAVVDTELGSRREQFDAATLQLLRNVLPMPDEPPLVTSATAFGGQPERARTVMTDEERKRVNEARAALDKETAALKGNAQQRAAAKAYLDTYNAAVAAGKHPLEATALAEVERTRTLRDQTLALGDTTKAGQDAAEQAAKVAAATVAANENLAASYRAGGEAVALAEAQKVAALAAAQDKHVSYAAEVTRALQTASSEAVAQLAASADAAEREADNRVRLAEAAAVSVQAEREVTAEIAAETATRDALNKALAESTNARTKEAKAAADARIAQVLEDRERIRRANLRGAGASDASAVETTLKQRQQELTLLRQQASLIGERPGVIARETAMLAERLKIQQSGTEEEKRRIEELVAAKGAVAEFAAEMQELERISTRTTDEITDGLVEAFDSGKSAVANFRNFFMTTAKQIVANSVFRPIIAPIVSGTIGSVMGVGGTGASGGAGGGGILGGLGQLGGLASGANSLFGGNLFSGLTASLDAFGASLGFASAAPIAIADPLAAAAVGMTGAEIGAGSVAGSLFGGATLSGFLGGFGIGSGLAGLLGLGSGNMLIDTASGLGGAGLGAAIGSVIPGIGTLVGAIIGGFGGTALGGLFGKKKPSIPAADVIYRGTGNDFEVVREWTNGGGNIAPVLEAGGEIGSGFLKLIEQLGGTGFTGRGGEIGYFIGDNKKEGPYGGATLDGVAIGGGYHEADPEKLVANIYKDLLGNIDVAGLSDEVNAAIRKSASIRETLDEVVGDIAFAKSIYEDNPLNPEKLTPLEQSLKTLEEQFEELKKKAEELGIATGLVTEKYDEAKDALKQGFIKSIDDQLLALMDPQAFALQQFEESFADLRKQAEIAGVDLVKIEQLYALQRAEVLKQASGGVLDQLREFAVSLRAGPLSALTGDEQYGGLKATFEATAAQALTGDVTAMGRIQAESQAFLEASRAMFGATGGYAADWQRVTGIIDQLANDGAAPAGWESLAQAQQAANDALQQVAVINDMSLSYTKDIRDDTRVMRETIQRLEVANTRMASEIADLNRQLRARG